MLDEFVSMRSDEGCMWRALESARATVGLASPNPQVGCVVVRDGVVVGEGAHFYDERDHAEIVALRKAGELARGATAYVTLEPCSHHGRTGPCADALIAAGVGRVVAATVDPNRQVRGRGIERLRAAGVEVVVGVCEAEARAVNDAFACWVRTGRPLVTLKAAVSADGMIAPAVSVRGEIHWVTGVEARAEVQRMRHGVDAVLTGIGTVLADDPLLTDRSGGARRRHLLRVVLDSRLRIPVDSRLLKTVSGDVLVVCDRQAEAEAVGVLEAAGAEVVRVAAGGAGRLDLGAVLDLLGRRKILSVMLECGSALNGAFLKQGLVDQVELFYSERELGPGAVPFAVGVEANELEHSLKGVTRTRFEADVRVSGVLRDVWEAVLPDEPTARGAVTS
jgi:diaminohydroxyphosphoribosylaminopyrimidine deaminase/5-amino-6-(5-phosphoribosylamino)uracil reductase